MRKLNATGLLNVLGICKIIASCAKNGVQKFAIGDLSIEFEQKAPEKPAFQAPAFAPPEPMTPEEIKARDQELELMRLDHLKLVDPMRYEEIMQKQEN